MKHLKRFNESKDSELDVIKDYFYNLVDDLENVCALEFKKNTSNYYTIYIEQSERITGVITKDTITKINTWISSSSGNSKILEEIKSSISRLEEESIIDNFKLERNNTGYILEIYTKLKEQNTGEWIFIEEDWSVWIDELRFKNYLKTKFNVKLESANFFQEFDRWNDPHLLLNIKLEEEYPVETLSKIIQDLVKIEVKNEEAEISINVFSKGTTFRMQETSDKFYMFLDSDVLDFQ
jgi:hypothetical protein